MWCAGIFPRQDAYLIPCAHCLRLGYAFEHLWTLLCKNGKNLIFHSLSDDDSLVCVSGFLIHRNRSPALKTGVDNL